jgi:hypothetical protein
MSHVSAFLFGANQHHSFIREKCDARKRGKGQQAAGAPGARRSMSTAGRLRSALEPTTSSPTRTALMALDPVTVVRAPFEVMGVTRSGSGVPRSNTTSVDAPLSGTNQSTSPPRG